jgi:hypothetical protein
MGFPVEEACHIAFSTIAKLLKASKKPYKVIFCCKTDANYSAYENSIGDVRDNSKAMAAAYTQLAERFKQKQILAEYLTTEIGKDFGASITPPKSLAVAEKKLSVEFSAFKTVEEYETVTREVEHLLKSIDYTIRNVSLQVNELYSPKTAELGEITTILEQLSVELTRYEVSLKTGLKTSLKKLPAAAAAAAATTTTPSRLLIPLKVIDFFKTDKPTQDLITLPLHAVRDFDKLLSNFSDADEADSIDVSKWSKYVMSLGAKY